MSDLFWFLAFLAPISILVAMGVVVLYEWPVRSAARRAWADELDTTMGSALGMSREEYRRWMEREENQ